MSNPIVTGLAGWGIHATRASFTPCTGAGIKIALLDTGFQPPHPDFKSRHITGQSFVPNEDPMDRVGHGTHCGGLACGPLFPTQYPRYGVAGGAQMWVLKVLGNDAAITKTDWLMAGIEMAIRHRCEIVCLPLGGPVAWGVPYAVHWEFLAQRALASGVLLMAAAGDESLRSRNVRCPTDSPANCPSIVAVGAVDAQMRVADFSNGGVSHGASGVDLVAPGVDIFSAYVAPASYRLLSGTSQAVALAAGIAALHAEKTGLRGDALRAELKRTAKPLPLDAADVGAGLVQAPV